MTVSSNDTTPTPTPAQVPVHNQSRTRALLWLTLGIIIIALAWLCLWFFYLKDYESTDDAYARGNKITINSAISASIVAFFADDTDLVEEGQLLIQLDPTNYQLAYQGELAALAATTLQVKQLYDTALSNQANAENKEALLKKAHYDYQNRLKLIGAQAVSNEEFIHAQDDFLIAQLNLAQAKYQLQVALDAAGTTLPQYHPLIEEQKAKVRTAYCNLQHCSIYAPSTGFVAQRAADVGEWVTPTTPLMAVIPTDYMWVDANFKETQLANMRIGQPAEVWFDLYGSKVKYQGKVIGIASGSGSVFSLIPPQNATGNWIKIVQRLPVRISLDPETLKKYPARLGISAEVSVDISNQDLPMLAQTPSTKPIATTNVFDIALEGIDKLMDEVIQAHLVSHEVKFQDYSAVN